MVKIMKDEKIPSVSALLPEELKKQITALLSKLTKEVSLKVILDKDEKSLELGSFLKVLSSCSKKLETAYFEKGECKELEEELNGMHLPVVGLYGRNDEGEYYSGACFHGVPGGKEINSFLAAICYLGGAATPLEERVLKQIHSIKKEVSIKVFVSLACHHCPHVAAACQKLAIESPYVTVDIYDANLYSDIVERYQIERVPMMILNESVKVMGQKNIEEITQYCL